MLDYVMNCGTSYPLGAHSCITAVNVMDCDTSDVDFNVKSTGPGERYTGLSGE